MNTEPICEICGEIAQAVSVEPLDAGTVERRIWTHALGLRHAKVKRLWPRIFSVPGVVVEMPDL